MEVADRTGEEHASTSQQQRSNRSNFTSMELDDVRELVAEFARERDWDQFHTVRNILIALVGEVGELAECFQWKGDKVEDGLIGFDGGEKEHVGEELADVMMYLARLSELCGIDLSAAVRNKMKKNKKKYPAHLCK